MQSHVGQHERADREGRQRGTLAAPPQEQRCRAHERQGDGAMGQHSQRHAIPRVEVAGVGEEEILIQQIEDVQRHRGHTRERVVEIPMQRPRFVHWASGRQRVLIEDRWIRHRGHRRGVLQVFDAPALLILRELGHHQRSVLAVMPHIVHVLRDKWQHGAEHDCHGDARRTKPGDASHDADRHHGEIPRNDCKEARRTNHDRSGEDQAAEEGHAPVRACCIAQAHPARRAEQDETH